MNNKIESLALPDVSGRYGAPMGRREYGHVDGLAPRTVHLFRMTMVDWDYDVGGAYWGGGTPIYCAFAPAGPDNDEFRKFTRAQTREAAALRMGIPARALRTGAAAVIERARSLGDLAAARDYLAACAEWDAMIRAAGTSDATPCRTDKGAACPAP